MRLYTCQSAVITSIFITLLYLLLRAYIKSPFNRPPSYYSYHGYCIRPYLYAGSDVKAVFPQDDVIDKMAKPTDLEQYEDDLTLLTHSSASALDWEYLSILLKTWRGPISLAVSLQDGYDAEYVNDQIFRSIEALKYKSDARRLAVHVMYGQKEGQKCVDTAINFATNSSGEMFVADYPINTVRNVARLFSSTRYIAMADSDYIFSKGFYEKMLSLARKEVPIDSKRALLYRIFEIEQNSTMDKNFELKKSDLKEIIDSKNGRVFHVREWPMGHYVPRLKEWLNDTENDQPGIFPLQLTNLKDKLYWEFQFVALRDVPMFDENFPYRADNNLELRWEVCRAGYDLRLVQDLFVYHILNGAVNAKDDIKKKISIKNKNWARFNVAKSKLMERMRLLYPSTIDRCPV